MKSKIYGPPGKFRIQIIELEECVLAVRLAIPHPSDLPSVVCKDNEWVIVSDSAPSNIFFRKIRIRLGDSNYPLVGFTPCYDPFTHWDKLESYLENVSLSSCPWMARDVEATKINSGTAMESIVFRRGLYVGVLFDDVAGIEEITPLLEDDVVIKCPRDTYTGTAQYRFSTTMGASQIKASEPHSVYSTLINLLSQT